MLNVSKSNFYRIAGFSIFLHEQYLIMAQKRISQSQWKKKDKSYKKYSIKQDGFSSLIDLKLVGPKKVNTISCLEKMYFLFTIFDVSLTTLVDFYFMKIHLFLYTSQPENKKANKTHCTIN